MSASHTSRRFQSTRLWSPLLAAYRSAPLSRARNPIRFVSFEPTVIQRCWGHYVDRNNKEMLAFSAEDIAALQRDCASWTATCAADIEIIAAATTQMTRFPSSNKRFALDNLIRNLGTQWQGRDPLTLRQALLCLGVLREHNTHDAAADMLISLVNKELVECLYSEGTRCAMDLEDIAFVLEQIVHHSRNTDSLRQLLMIITKQLSLNVRSTASAACITRLLLALRHKYSGLVVDGRGNFKLPDITTPLIDTLPPIVRQATGSYQLVDLLEIIAQFEELNSQTDGEKELVCVIGNILDENFKNASSSGIDLLSGQLITRALFGLQNMSSDLQSVRQLVGVLAKIMNVTSGDYHTNTLLLSLKGMMCMSSDVPEVRSMVAAITAKLREHKSPDGRNPSHKYVLLAISGLQSMNSDSTEVRALLQEISPAVLTSLSKCAFPNCFFYLRNMREDHAPEIFDFLMRCFSRFENNSDSYIKAHRRRLSLEQYRMCIARFLRMGKSDILSSLNTKHGQQFDKLLKGLDAVLPILERASSSFMSVAEERFYNSLKVALHGMQNLQVQSNVILLGFECDVLLTAIDTQSEIVHMIVNIEIDFSQRHEQPLGLQNDNLRDKYLLRDHGIIVLRLNRSMLRRLKANRATIKTVLGEAVEMSLLDENKMNLLKMHLVERLSS